MQENCERNGGNYHQFIQEPGAESHIFEKYRKNKEKIAKNIESFDLSRFRDIWWDHFDQNIKAEYDGKMKDLLLYFEDIWKVWNDPFSTRVIIYSLLFAKQKQQQQHQSHSLNGSAKKRQSFQYDRRSKSLSTSPSKKREKLRWIQKKKESATQNDINKIEREHKENDFRYGPSAMYTVPRSVPKSHSHIIGQTAAVGTANAFYSNPYASKNNRFGTSGARPYTSSRRHSQFGQKKAKTYGDYEDELPHTPSGSEDDSY